MSTSVTSPLTFTGVSSFSSDFQSILSRANQIAQIPITALQNQQANVLSEEQAATNLEAAVSALTTDVTNLANVGSTAGITTTSSAPNTVAVAYSSLTTPQSFAITNISSVASAASETSLSGYANETTTPASASGQFRLVVGSTTYPPTSQAPITLDSAHNNLDGLRDAINALNAGVTATVLNTGNGSTPYYLSIAANSTGKNAIQLVDQGTSANVLTSLNPGANADFYLNGAHVVSSSNVVTNAVAGLVLTVEGTTSANQTVTISAASDPTTISSALQDFVTKYNAVKTLLDGQIGSAAGQLSGNYLVYGIQDALRGLVNYVGPGNLQNGDITNLAQLGIEMDPSGNGQMSFNQSTFNSLTSAQIASAFSFLGSTTTGFGALSSSLSAFSDPVTGAIQAEQSQFNTTYQNLGNQVTTLTDQANAMAATLQQKLQAADTLVANLQSEQQMLNASIESLNFSSYGYQSSNNSSFSPMGASGGGTSSTNSSSGG